VAPTGTYGYAACVVHCVTSGRVYARRTKPIDSNGVARVRMMCGRALRFLALISAIVPVCAAAETVALAGFAFAGADQAVRTRFPRTQAISERSRGFIDSRIFAAAKSVSNPNFILDATGNVREGPLKDIDRAIVTAIVISGETVSVEPLAGIWKVYVNLRADALFYEYKSSTIVRSFPISVAYIDAFRGPPTEAQLTNMVEQLIFGDKGVGLLPAFLTHLSSASLPGPATRYLRIRSSVVSDDVLSQFPQSLRANRATVENIVADQFSSEIARTGIPLLPYMKGHAVGQVLAIMFGDTSVFNLKIPESDYALDVSAVAFKKIKHAEVSAGASYIYGTLVHIKLSEPLSNRIYLDSQFKNGEVKVVPASQSDVVDFPAYNDSLRRLFAKFADGVREGGSAWIETSASTKDIQIQVRNALKVMESCK
jgi:hypothetical protein